MQLIFDVSAPGLGFGLLYILLILFSSFAKLDEAFIVLFLIKKYNEGNNEFILLS